MKVERNDIVVCKDHYSKSLKHGKEYKVEKTKVVDGRQFIKIKILKHWSKQEIGVWFLFTEEKFDIKLEKHEQVGERFYEIFRR